MEDEEGGQEIERTSSDDRMCQGCVVSQPPAMLNLILFDNAAMPSSLTSVFMPVHVAFTLLSLP